MGSATSEFEQLRKILVSPEVAALQSLECDIEDLRRHIHDPEKFASLLQPVLVTVFQQCDPSLGLALISAITPFVDRAIRERARQDPASIASALSAASTGAIALRYEAAPEAAAGDLAPLVSAAFKEQIRGERDAMIDALYPIIGSTIAKYLSQTLATLVQTINDRIESNLSVGAVIRRVRARFLGLSEAELLLRESMPWHLDAAFLIHKASGLVIAQAQDETAHRLDPDLLSGMLTAIRSLFNDSLVSSPDPRELDQIDYGESKIVLEVAGFCYIAAVGRGIPDEAFRRRMRETLGAIVQTPGDTIESYAGNPAAVPAGVARSITGLVGASVGQQSRPKSSGRYPLALAGLFILLVLSVPLAVHFYRNSADRDTEARTRAALSAEDPFLPNEIDVAAYRGKILLTGRTTNDYLSSRAGAIARSASPEMTVENGVTPDPGPPLPVLTSARIREVASVLNTEEGVYVEPRFGGGELALAGFAPDSATVRGIIRSFARIPGVRTLTSAVGVGEGEVGTPLYFAVGSAAITPEGRTGLASLADILARTPWSKLVVTGHTDRAGGDGANRLVAAGRANAVRSAIVALGVSPDRVIARGSSGRPPGSLPAAADGRDRCVRFTLVGQSRPESR